MALEKAGRPWGLIRWKSHLSKDDFSYLDEEISFLCCGCNIHAIVSEGSLLLKGVQSITIREESGKEES